MQFDFKLFLLRFSLLFCFTFQFSFSFDSEKRKTQKMVLWKLKNVNGTKELERSEKERKIINGYGGLLMVHQRPYAIDFSAFRPCPWKVSDSLSNRLRKDWIRAQKLFIFSFASFLSFFFCNCELSKCQHQVTNVERTGECRRRLKEEKKAPEEWEEEKLLHNSLENFVPFTRKASRRRLNSLAIWERSDGVAIEARS